MYSHRVFIATYKWLQTLKPKKTASKVNFSIIHLVRIVCELTSSIIQTHYTRTTLFCLHLLSCSRSKTTEHLLQKQCTERAAFADAGAFFLERLLSGQFVSLVLCILPPLRQFCAFFLLFSFMHSSSSSSVSCSHLSPRASNSNPPYLKTANFRKALNAKSMFIGSKTFFTSQDRLYTSAPEMAWNIQMSMNNNSINA